MKDPAVTIMACLKAGWLLTGVLAIDNIKFTTGWFDSELKTPQIVVLEDESISDTWELGYGTIKVTAMYKVEVWVSAVKTTSKGRGKAKDYRFKLVEEIRRIIKANQSGLKDLWKVKLHGRGRPIDLLRNNPPILTYSQRFTVIYSV